MHERESLAERFEANRIRLREAPETVRLVEDRQRAHLDAALPAG